MTDCCDRLTPRPGARPGTARRLVAAVAGAVAASTALAGPVAFSRIDPDAGWVAHWNAEAARQCSPATILSTRGDCFPARAISGVERDLGIAQADVLGITLFGLDRCSARQAMLIETNSTGATSFSTVMESTPSIRAADEAGVHYYSWARGEGAVFAALATDRAGTPSIILTDTRGSLLRCIAVITGSWPSLAKEGDATTRPALPDAGSVLYVWAGGLSSCPQPVPEAQMLRHSRAVTIDLGKTRQPEPAAGRMYLHARIDMPDEQMAGLMEQVVRGAIAMSILSARDDVERAPLSNIARNVALRVEGPTLVVTGEEDESLVARVVEMLAQQHVFDGRAAAAAPATESTP